MTTAVEPSEGKQSGSRSRGVLIAIGLVLVVAVAAVVIVKRRSAVAPATTASAEPPVAVKSEPIVEDEVPVTLRLAGTLRGNRETDLAANAAGRVLSTSVERGDTVKQGQALAKLDVREAALSAKQARAEAEGARVQQDQAQRECNRYEALYKSGSVSDYEYQQRVTQCKTAPFSAAAASARASLAAKNVGDGIIRAPFTGVVTERYVEVGQYVRQDSRIVTIVTLDQLRLEFSIPEADAAKVHEGMKVAFHVAAFPKRTFDAKVRFISGAINPATRDLTVEALIDNQARELKSGMFADIDLAVAKKKLPVLPRSAILEKDSQAHAFFAVDGRIEERVLSLGNAIGDRVGVESGAKAGERVIVGDLGRLVNGQRIVENKGAF